MLPTNQSPNTFIVRLWREKSDGESIWRGSVDHVQSGERAYFQSAARLADVISSLLKEVVTQEIDSKQPKSIHPISKVPSKGDSK